MFRRFWQGWQGSNSRHSVLETDALPTELHPYICIMMIAEGGRICQGHLETGALPIELRPYGCAMMIAAREGFVKANIIHIVRQETRAQRPALRVHDPVCVQPVPRVPGLPGPAGSVR